MATRTTKARGGRGTLTASMLGSLPPGDHTDTAVKGLQLRVRQGRDGTTSRVWLFRFAWRGEGVRISIGRLPTMTPADARQRGLELRAALDDGIDPRRARPRRRITPSPLPLSAAPAPGDAHSIEYLVSEFATRYLRPHRKDPQQAEAIIARDVLPPWSGRDVRTITPREVIDLLDGIVDRGAPVLANRTAAVLAQLFRFAVQRRIVEASPVQLLMPPGGPESARDRVLSEDELRIFLSDPEACTRFPKMARVITVLLLTGQRKGELMGALWRDIDLNKGLWTIPDENSKSGRGHIVPLSAWAIEELQWLKREGEGSPWVLPVPGDPARRLSPKALTRSIVRCRSRFAKRGIPHFTLHDLRRTCRTGLSRLKVQPHVAERVLNHAQPGVAGVYDRFEYIDEKREALDKWAAYLEGLKAMGPPHK